MTIPGTPKDMLSYVAGLTPLTLKEWLTIVVIARIPSLLTSVSGGAAGENYLLAGIMLALTRYSAVWVFYIIGKSAKSRRNKKAGTDQSVPV